MAGDPAHFFCVVLRTGRGDPHEACGGFVYDRGSEGDEPALRAGSELVLAWGKGA